MNTNNMSGSILTFVLGVELAPWLHCCWRLGPVKELREDISGKVTDGANELKAAGKHVKRKAQSFVTNAKERVDEAVQAGEATFNAANNG